MRPWRYIALCWSSPTSGMLHALDSPHAMAHGLFWPILLLRICGVPLLQDPVPACNVPSGSVGGLLLAPDKQKEQALWITIMSIL